MKLLGASWSASSQIGLSEYLMTSVNSLFLPAHFFKTLSEICQLEASLVIISSSSPSEQIILTLWNIV